MRYLIAALVGVFATASAYAADIGGMKDVDTRGRALVAADAASSPFAGPYAGISVSWQNQEVDHGGTLAFPNALTENGFTYGEPVSGRLADMEDDAFRFGAQAGYNWQIGRVYFGPRVSLDIGKLESAMSRTDVLFEDDGFSVQHDGKLSVSTDYLAAASLKLGIAVTNNIGVYGLVGVSAADVNMRAGGSWSATDGENQFRNILPWEAANSDMRVGYHLGGGVDLVLGDWQVFAEYVRHDLGTIESRGTTYGGLISYTHEADVIVDVVKAGVNYRF